MPTQKSITIRNTLYLLLFALAVGARVLPGPRTIDDSFITFRYARNLTTGQGFVYNPGEKVLGTTTPLYTLTIAGLAWISGKGEAPYGALALGVNALADGITCLLLLGIGIRLGARWAAWGSALSWAIAPFSVTFAIGGLETSLYVLLLTGLALAYLEGRYTLAAFLAALALLTRPDALILLGPLVLDRLLSSWRGRSTMLRWSEALAGLIPLLAWGVFATIYFGSPLTHSVAAKSLAYRLPGNAAFIRLLQHFATPFLGHLTFGQMWIAAGLVLYPFLSLLGTWRAGKEHPRSWPFLIYPWLYFTTFAVANPLIFRWYLTPPLPFYFLGILIGAEKIILDLDERIGQAPGNSAPPKNSWQAKAVLALVVILAPFLLSLKDWTLHPDHGLDRPAPAMAWYQLELLYRQAAETLAPDLEPDSVLAASDVGVLGFYTDAQILDTVGLNSPIALEYYPVDPAFYVINLATSPDLILDQKPDFVVLLEVYGRLGVFKDSRFKDSYRLLEKIPTDIYGSDGMLILCPPANAVKQTLKGPLALSSSLARAQYLFLSSCWRDTLPSGREH